MTSGNAAATSREGEKENGKLRLEIGIQRGGAYELTVAHESM